MSQSTPRPARPWLTVAAYAGLLAAAVAVFFLIRSHGETLTAPPPEPGTAAGVGSATGKGHALFHVLLALAAVIALGRLLGGLFTYIGQPPVIGEVVAGILLGPSLLGRVAPEAYAFLLPPSVGPFLGVVAQLGVILYMFLVGLELNPALLRGRAQATVTTSHA